MSQPIWHLEDQAVGIATAGSLRSYYVMPERYADNAWILWWRNPAVPDEELQSGIDAGDDLLGDDAEAIRALDEVFSVQWLPASQASAVRRRFFSFPEPPGPLARLSQLFRRSGHDRPPRTSR